MGQHQQQPGQAKNERDNVDNKAAALDKLEPASQRWRRWRDQKRFHKAQNPLKGQTKRSNLTDKINRIHIQKL
jgi:hypothetical protein